MENYFGKLADKLKAVKELKSLGIENDQALDIVFESVEQNEHVQYMQEIFKVAFMYGQLHEHSKKSEDYTMTDEQARNECISYCTKFIR